MDFRLRKLHEKLAHSNGQLAKAPSTPSPSASSGGFMTRLLKAAVADDKPRQQLPNSAINAARKVREMHKHHQECHEGWGRQRWPLLVAARGWGDPSVTAGKYPRHLRAQERLIFPCMRLRGMIRSRWGIMIMCLGARTALYTAVGRGRVVACARGSSMGGIVWRHRRRIRVRILLGEVVRGTTGDTGTDGSCAGVW